MKTFNRSTFEQLSEITSDYAVSIYIPTQEVGDNRNKSMTKLKNHIQKTERELESMGIKPREIKDFLEPIKKLLDDSTLFRELDQSLVVFRCKSTFEYYTLPIEVEEFLIVSHIFHLLPLLQFFNKKDSFYIFTLSQNRNRLFEIGRASCRERV